MPRRDDEQSIGARDESLIKVFDWNRKPKALRTAFGSVWTDRFGAGSIKDIGHSTWYSWEDQVGIYLALEHLRIAGLIPHASIFDKKGRLLNDIQPADVEVIFGPEGILKGKRVMVFGGPEAEVFQAMGAQAVGFDPELDRAVAYGLESSRYNRTIKKLEKLAAESLNGWADLTYSYNLFDPGSGLVAGEDRRNEQYSYNLGIVLSLTKPGGVSVHNGNGLIAAVHPVHDRGFSFQESFGLGDRRYRDLAGQINRDISISTIAVRVVEIAPVNEESGVGDPSTTYVLQRKAAAK